VVVHDARGRFVTDLTHDRYDAGEHQIQWNGTNFSGDRVASGVYFVTISSTFGDDIRKLVLVK
jgi:flagellar hook assembly protein FlgD